MKTLVPVFALLLSAAVLAAGLPFTTIAKGDMSGQETMKQVVVRTPAEWQALWKMHAPDAKLPVVDFTTKMVVGMFAGTKPTDGYETEIVNVKTDGDALVVEYVQRMPKRGMMAAQILTQPFHVIAVAKHPDPVRFVQIADPAPPPPPTLK